MKNLRKFDISIVKPNDRDEELVYELDESFFKLLENNLLEKGTVIVKVKVDKKPTLTQLLFTIEGAVELTCDRSLEKFDYPINIGRRVIFRLGDENKELCEDMYTVSRSESTINIAQHIHDFINLSVPMKKLHPRFQEE
ncbi:MAG: DUF177 domain-containing protein [Cytophagales bacterium]|nr:DUF177 domain-containing protein [Cytophagales bacterium]